MGEIRPPVKFFNADDIKEITDINKQDNMAHAVGTEAYFKADKFKIVIVYRRIGIYEFWSVENRTADVDENFSFRLSAYKYISN